MKNLIARAEIRFCIPLITVLLLSPTFLFGQHTLNGIILDDQGGKPIEGAVIQILNSFQYSNSNEEGKFTFSGLKGDKVDLFISHLSYEKETLEVKLPTSELKFRLKPHSYLSEEITVSATRVPDGSSIAYNNISKEDLEKSNLGQDLPYLLQMSPSVAVTSDAGAGIGYSGLRIRGSDASRINVTINGIPVNDAESHQVYWVDLPDLASSTDNIQIQRGVGTSTNGTGAFGGSVNIQTSTLHNKPYASINTSAGSFNTFKNTLGFGSGLLSEHFSLDGKLSLIHSDGYIDRASSDLKSFFIMGAYIGKKSSLKAIVMSGKEKTYQAWYGVPQDSIKNNRTFNPAGMYYDVNGEIKFYDDQTDNYRQDNYQLLYTQEFNHQWSLNLALHGTIGQGYYEEYAAGDAFSNYSLPDLVTPTDTITNSDFIRQRWLSNDFYGATANLNYEKKKIKMIFGGAANSYRGDHYGELIWSRDAALSSNPMRYYSDDAEKNELTFYVKLSTTLFNKLDCFGELQLRTLDYNYFGPDNGGLPLQQSASYTFFNPKGGFSYSFMNEHQLYCSAAIGQKEPIRDDFVNSSPSSRPRSEKMIDYEAGYRMNSGKLQLTLNYYYMDYQNQLILNGKINDVGEYSRQNVNQSYRTGIELEVDYLLSRTLRLQGNATLSKNKIKLYEEYLDDYDVGDQFMKSYSSTDIAFSPSVIASGMISWAPLKSLSADLLGKYIGRQYLDNTQNPSRSIDGYLLNDLRIRYVIHPGFMKEIGLNLHVNNIFNTQYVSNGFTYSYISGGETSTFNYYYPQAGRNFMFGVSMLFE